MSVPTITSSGSPPLYLFFVLPITFYIILSIIIFKFDPFCYRDNKEQCVNSLYIPLLTIFITSCFSYVMFMLYLDKEKYILPLSLAIVVILIIHYTIIVPKYFEKK